MLGVPAVCTRSTDDIEGIRKQRAEAQQKQQAMEQMAAAAPAAIKRHRPRNLSEGSGGGREVISDWLGGVGANAY